MATYSFKTIEDRKELQRLYEEGLSSAQIAEKLDVSPQVIRRELWRGSQDEVRLPDFRLKYDADLAQLRMQRSLERRGVKNYKRDSNLLSQWDKEE